MDDHTVTGRVVAVLDAVAALGDHATLAALTRCTGIPKPTVRRIAGDLAVRGLLDRRGDVYRLGPALLRLGIAAGEQHGMRNVAAHLQDLHARCGEIVWLITFGPPANTLACTVFGSNRIAAVRRGTWPMDGRDPAFLSTAAGQLLLAERRDLVEDLRARSFPRMTSRTDWRQTVNGLAMVGDTGMAVEHEQSTLGMSCVAAGVRDSAGALIAAVGVCGPTRTLPTARLTRPILTTADGLSEVLTS